MQTERDSSTFTNPASDVLKIGTGQKYRTGSTDKTRFPQPIGIKAGEALVSGGSPAMTEIQRLLARVARVPYPILITGESGTGKESIARAIHANSGAVGPFVSLDCAALLPSFIETELFGHGKGGFPGALRAKTGLLCHRNGGTVLLDEIGNLSLNLQAKLLRALQEKEVRPAGATHAVPISTRLLAATSHDLNAMVSSGQFRKDLLYRINVVHIVVPPLRDRRDDIAILATHFLNIAREQLGERYRISQGALELLSIYDWPGNVRELKHTIERMCALSESCMLDVDDLPDPIKYPPVEEREPDVASPENSIVPLLELEKRAICEAIERLRGDKLEAAKLLGIGKTTLYRKLKEYRYGNEQHSTS